MAVINYANRTYAEVQDLIEQMLQDTPNATYDTTELGYWIEESLKEFATYIPHIVPVVFKIESRTGSDAAGTSNKLTDTSESQFVAGDATLEKVIHNETESTWAVVEAQDSTSVLSLNADIMNSGDNYRIYNKRCWNEKQIYIGDVTDYLEIDSVEYPIGTKRSWKIYNDVLEIDVNYVADSDSTQSPLQNIDVLVRFAKPHKLNQLTDWSGESNAAGTKGATTLAIDGMGATEIIERGDEFYFQYHRTLYTITKDVTTSANAATITFFPGLEAAVTADDDIEFVKSTLQPQHEELFCHLVAARAAMSKGAKSIQEIGTAITTLSTVNSTIDNMTARITQCITDIGSGRTEVDKIPAIVTKAEASIALVQGHITQAIADVHTGRDKINEINKGGVGVPTTYTNYASAELTNASALISKSQAHFSQATKDESVARTYSQLGARELQVATASLSQAGGYIREISSRLQVAASWTQYQDWGERKLAEVSSKLDRISTPKTKRIYSRG